jgi:hypothetical protein
MKQMTDVFVVRVTEGPTVARSPHPLFVDPIASIAEPLLEADIGDAAAMVNAPLAPAVIETPDPATR